MAAGSGRAWGPSMGTEAVPPAPLAAPGFVGRDRHLAELRAALAAATSGRGRLVLLAGEPGIGKTRLADELVAHARTLETGVLWASCWDGDGAPAFWPWIQVVRAYARECDAAALPSELGSGAADLVRLVPELRERCPGLPAPPRADRSAGHAAVGWSSESDRFRLFDAVATLLKNAAARRPLLLVLDDLHWSDRPSLLLLRFLARELRSSRLLVLGTYRDVEVGPEHPLVQLLGEPTSESQRLALGGLSPSEVHALVAGLVETVPDEGTVAALHRQTGGNPFFVKELVRLLAAPSATAPPEQLGPGELLSAQGVREVVEHRLARLP